MKEIYHISAETSTQEEERGETMTVATTLFGIESQPSRWLAETLRNDPDRFVPEVFIEAARESDTTVVEKALHDAEVDFMVRRVTHGAIKLVQGHLTYSGPSAVEAYLADRD